VATDYGPSDYPGIDAHFASSQEIASLVRESLKWDLHDLVGLVYVPELSVCTAELVAWTVTVPAHIEEHRRRVGYEERGSPCAVARYLRF
jgi:hypothetical protein